MFGDICPDVMTTGGLLDVKTSIRYVRLMRGQEKLLSSGIILMSWVKLNTKSFHIGRPIENDVNVPPKTSVRSEANA